MTNENPNRTAVPAPYLEPHPGHAPLGAQETPRLDTRLSIRVISYRKRRHDPDGISAKAAIDGLVRAGVLPNDSTDHIKSVTFESIQGDEEKTIIEIDDGA